MQGFKWVGTLLLEMEAITQLAETALEDETD